MRPTALCSGADGSKSTRGLPHPGGAVPGNREAGRNLLVAHHCTEAGLIEQAVGYWLKAGSSQAATRSAMPEAVAQLERGLELLPGLPDGIERIGSELDLQIALGPALMGAKDTPDLK